MKKFRQWLLGWLPSLQITIATSDGHLPLKTIRTRDITRYGNTITVEKPIRWRIKEQVIVHNRVEIITPWGIIIPTRLRDHEGSLIVNKGTFEINDIQFTLLTED